MAKRKSLTEAARGGPVFHDMEALKAQVKGGQTEPAEAPGPRAAGGKERMTFHLPAELIDRLRNAVYWTPGLTLAGLAEEALTEALDRLEQDRGGPFPKRGADLKGGRPVKP